MDQQYIRRLEKIEAAIQRWLPETADPGWTAAVFPGIGEGPGAESIDALLAPGRDLLSRGGKRWWPLLMTLVCESLGGGSAALPLAPLVELCHNASLIHDDIEDNSDERRGKPAVHLIYGADTAINGGCFLYFLPLSCVEPWAAELAANAGLSADAALEYKNRVYALWAEYMRKLHLGQAMDIRWHRNFDLIPRLDEYYTMCGLKTGCLARFAAALGVCAAEAAAADAAGKGAYGEVAGRMGVAAEQLGVGFQILDDVKNLSAGVPGKKRGDDVVEGKKSLPVLLYLHRYPERRELVARCFTAARSGGVSVPEVEELIQALTSAGTLDEAGEKGRALVAAARAAFAGLPAFPPGNEAAQQAAALLAGLTELIS